MIAKKPRARFCNSGCAESFREDRRCGLIYPAIRTPAGAYSVERWSLLALTCCYCGALVGGRAIDEGPNWA